MNIICLNHASKSTTLESSCPSRIPLIGTIVSRLDMFLRLGHEQGLLERTAMVAKAMTMRVVYHVVAPDLLARLTFLFLVVHHI
jgi:hypothetical protein